MRAILALAILACALGCGVKRSPRPPEEAAPVAVEPQETLPLSVSSTGAEAR